MFLFTCFIVGGCLLAGGECRRYGSSKIGESKIVGGFDAEDGKYPYQVSLRMWKTFHFCGGSIINEYWILTAAHCLNGQKTENITVVAGSNLLSSGGDFYEPEKFIINPAYVEEVIINDIALIKLKTPIVMGDKVQRIKLPEVDTKTGENLTLTGWGISKYPIPKNSTGVPDKLQMLNLIAIGLLKCNIAHLTLPVFIGPKQICTLTDKGEGACMGDSGGPLVHADYQVGVVSWGIPCGQGKPDVFTRVYSYVEWIKFEMSNNTTTSQTYNLGNLIP